MRSPGSGRGLTAAPAAAALLLLGAACNSDAAGGPYFTVISGEPGSWPQVLSSIGLQQQPAPESQIFIAGPGAAAAKDWPARVEKGAILILEGESTLAEQFGFRPGTGTVKVTSLIDARRPSLTIVWEREIDLPVFDVPAEAQIFAKERWKGAPVVAGQRLGAGAVLWVAAPPGERGHERFPFLLDALCELGLEPPFRSGRLWAFMDSSYRSRVDIDYFAARWRKSGIAGLHVAAWHFWEADPDRDAYLKKLIEACHREGILVYAWLELPHVSDLFWNDHPEWREKTALRQDAQLDWRKLMNLQNRDCFRAVAAGMSQLATRFDWDGINLAELYFESLQGIDNPSRFTPMNDDVRAEFRKLHGFDPIEIFGEKKDAGFRKAFLDYRADLARRMQEEWIAQLETIRARKPYLDLVLTHVDDRFDTGIREAIGADASRALPLLDKHNVTFLIEDPATLWHLGGERYHDIAERYRALTPHRDRLAIDLNIVDRYQNVYPTKQQTGTELLQLVHNAAANFGRVALYFESSLGTADWRLLPSAAAAAARVEKPGQASIVASVTGVGIPWKGPALVDGKPWPAADEETVWLPAGVHSVEAARDKAQAPHLVRLNGDLRSASVTGAGAIEFSYQSAGRAIAVLDRPPKTVRVDGKDIAVPAGSTSVLLPNGQHTVTVRAE
jgi:hypothetical protein